MSSHTAVAYLQVIPVLNSYGTVISAKVVRAIHTLRDYGFMLEGAARNLPAETLEKIVDLLPKGD